MECEYKARAGWGDTATLTVLADILDLEVLVFTTPDARLDVNDIPQKPRALRFRKGGKGNNSSPRRLFCHFHNGHYNYLRKTESSLATRLGPAAPHEHYLNGTHDVSTGMCDSLPCTCT